MAYIAGRLYVAECRSRNREPKDRNTYYVAANTVNEAIEKLLKAGVIVEQEQVMNVLLKMQPVIV